MKLLLLLVLALLSAHLSLAGLPSTGDLQPFATVPSLTAPGPCEACVQLVAPRVLNHTLQGIKAACHDPSSPIYPHCPFIATHPRFSLGYIVAKTHPVQVGYVYCVGAGKCGADERPQLTGAHPDLGLDTAAFTAQVIAAFPSPPTSSSPLPPPFSAYDESPSLPSPTPSPFPRLLSQLSSLSPSSDADATCTACLEHFIAAQLEADFKAIAAYCHAHASDPVVVARCEAVAADVPYAAGSLYAEQEPQKFAAGVCVAARKCSTEQARTVGQKVVM